MIIIQLGVAVFNHFPNFEAKASCADYDPEWWFPTEVGGKSKAWSRTPEAMKAREICAECPALMECRNYALAYSGLAGIWGGLDHQERTKLQDKLGITPIFMLDTYPQDMFSIMAKEGVPLPNE
jgi:WhiB family redox-sensing transcriptional regulator